MYPCGRAVPRASCHSASSLDVACRGRSRGVCRVARKAGLQVADTLPEYAVLFFEQVDTLVLKVRTLFKQLKGGQHRW